MNDKDNEQEKKQNPDMPTDRRKVLRTIFGVSLPLALNAYSVSAWGQPSGSHAAGTLSGRAAQGVAGSGSGVFTPIPTPFLKLPVLTPNLSINLGAQNTFMVSASSSSPFMPSASSSSPFMPSASSSSPAPSASSSSPFMPSASSSSPAPSASSSSPFMPSASSFAVSPSPSSNTALPVELLDFTAQENDDTIVLNWTTSREVENKGFEIQRSTTGGIFSKIAWVDGERNSNQRRSYRLVDRDVTAGPVYFYRLKQVDVDGRFSYSPIDSASIEAEARTRITKVYPTVVRRGLLNVEISALAQDRVDVRVFSTEGRLIVDQETLLSKGLNTIRLQFGSVPTGTYILQVNFATHGGRVTRQFIVSR